MRRLFSNYAYDDGPRDGCWWDETVPLPVHDALHGDVTCDVAIVGAGFTGLSAALTLAREGARVIVLDAVRVGWGASGRNGGFCCLGGGMRADAALDREFGVTARRMWRATERRAVDDVEALIQELSLNVDRHSNGETCLAHRARDFRAMTREASSIRENYGVEPELLSQSELAQAGMSGPFHGGLTVPIGFGLNPRKLLAGMVDACVKMGVTFHEGTAVVDVAPGRVAAEAGVVHAQQIVIATNGYSSEDVPNWMTARYMPAQSTVIVTRPLSSNELANQGWTSAQMAYDTQHLLHYFRLMPDRRFLFGMRGGLKSGPTAERRARRAAMHDFRRMFPSWSHVDITHSWSGLVCLARHRVPFVGPVPDMPGVFVGFAYHGNGLAMGVHSGRLLAGLVNGTEGVVVPEVMARPAAKFPLGRFRRLLMPGIYAALKLADVLP